MLLAIAAATLALILYALTLQPDFGGPEDTPKFQFVGYVLGIPHPPGYPLYVLLSHGFVSLVPMGTVAYRANLFSAVMAAVACGLAFAIARQSGARPWASFFGALGLATGASFWRSAVFAEVYSLAAVMAALSVSLLLAWGLRGGATRLVAAFGAFAFGLGNHLTIVGIVPAFAAYVLTRGRPVWSVRVVASSALLLALGLAQYGLIVVRTRQGAPYVETAAANVTDLYGVVTAERFADQRFAFGITELVKDHLPILVSVIAREFGPAGTILFVFFIGAVISGWGANPAFVLGAAAGMFVMVLNLTGDLKGFITPVMVLLWPLAAVGADRAASHARRVGRIGPAAAAIVVAAAALAPVANLLANYKENDHSDRTESAAFLRGVFSHLPERAGIVAEDYWLDMAWHYYRATGEAGQDRAIERVAYQAAEVRRAVRDGRPVFALSTAATFLTAEGLSFKRVTLERPSLDHWLASLPRGTVVAGATAYAPLPSTLGSIGHANARPPGRDRSFEAFAAVAGRPGSAWRREDAGVVLHVEPGSLSAPLPPFAGALVASSGPQGARVELAGRSIARAENGVALAAFAPDGTLAGTLELAPGEAYGMEPAGAVYEFAGESPCATLAPGTWTDLDGVLANGSWVATMHGIGSTTIETVASGTHDLRASSAVLLGDGSMLTTVTPDSGGDIMTTAVTRKGESRVLFRLALDRPLSRARARVRSDGAGITLCALTAARPLFEPGGTIGVLRPDFESEAYFGAGWREPERTPTGPVRRGDQRATLLLPLEPGRAYRLSLDLAADEPLRLDVTINETSVGSCEPRGAGLCEVSLPAASIHAGVNTVTLKTETDRARTGVFTFRGARIVKKSS